MPPCCPPAWPAARIGLPMPIGAPAGASTAAAATGAPPACAPGMPASSAGDACIPEPSPRGWPNPAAAGRMGADPSPDEAPINPARMAGPEVPNMPLLCKPPAEAAKVPLVA